MPAVTKVAVSPMQVGSKSDSNNDLNDELANGPLENRSCRDVICCILFIAFLGGMLGVVSYAITKGNPELIGRGYDSDGKMCGISSGYEQYTFLYFANPIYPYLNQTVCVSSCPVSASVTTIKCQTNSVYPTCAAHNTTKPQSGSMYYYATIPFLERLCVPTSVSTIAKDASNQIFSIGILEQWISDIKTTSSVIAASVGVAFIIGLIYTLILKYCSGILTWAAIISFIVFLGVLGWRFFEHAKDLQNELDSASGSSDKSSNTQKTITADKAIAYICWGIAGVVVLLTICLYQRIKLAIAILKAAADFIRQNVLIFLVPIITTVILVAFFAFWATTLVYLVSCGNATQIQDVPFGDFEYDKKIQRLMAFHLFGLLWFSAFMVASTQFIIASSVCIWYFAQGTSHGASGNIRKSVVRLFRYHFGSVAFGSLILAIVQFIRIILTYIEHQMKKSGANTNKFAQYALKCAQCCMACFERFVKFLNKNAYIQIALSGKSFCFAAKDGFLLAIKNPLRFSVLNGVAGVFVWFGKVFISALTALAAYLVITKWDKFSAQLYSPIIPVLIILIFAYAIGGVFMSLYGMAADAILACFVLDEELNKKKNAPPRHCPPSLKPFLDMHARKNN